ncbi:16S rRNA (guanine(966)-N(2))-methyltransferase RsmD [Pseudothauera nasutitermitis]|uniref:16S rRNA (Guanine(966)-N(2))-methyltransferase RsmD n=1 Tax=Pseudothauera nasutitermitis TaxID=2565930 RepID=A0A4S4AW04_9RHOO|nr:16S rRNA (guanine(966)-N(2))-methyltransferase RsmD [Pseudothauera nasutitermitis]THF63790.1 16S rRNA (guanine(966)-N(2))-methyltransferase RsmD [Pseudothauera nasutitermitis]
MSRVRIVGGQWRSRQIDVASATGLRPTPDRVRETLFNWLGQQLDGLHCLDLFAGSGILGFEAASRGAQSVTLVEHDARAFAALRQAATALQAGQVELVRGDAVKFAESAPRGFDLVFLDPPYKRGWLERIEPLLGRILQPDGWLYAEAEAPLEGLGNWRTVKQGRAGQVHFHLMRGHPG